ncbi:MAG: hypothetical protein IT181_13250 [Acidobacteria bacterium]|nr:hypothetical protein [Acidobacteriota bacterium]
MGSNVSKIALMIGMVITGLGTQVQSMHTIDEAKTPAFIGGAMLVVGAALVAVWVEKPGSRP